MEVASLIFCEDQIKAQVLEFFCTKGNVHTDNSDYYIIDNNDRVMYVVHTAVDYDYEKELNNSKEVSEMAINMFPKGTIRQIDISFKNHDQFYVDIERLLVYIGNSKVIIESPFDGVIHPK